MVFVIVTFTIFFILAFPRFSIGVLFYIGMYVLLGSFSKHFRKWYFYGTTIIGALGYHAISVLSREYAIAKWFFTRLNKLIIDLHIKQILGSFLAPYYATGILLLFVDLLLIGIYVLIIGLLFRDEKEVKMKKNNLKRKTSNSNSSRKVNREKTFDEILKETNIHGVQK